MLNRIIDDVRENVDKQLIRIDITSFLRLEIDRDIPTGNMEGNYS